MSDFTFVNPTTLTPLFTAQQVVCTYSISDLYASSPRYLYYALLAACFVTHWTGWLAHVFLGAAATYAGTAAIEAIIFRANPSRSNAAENVTIPLVMEPVMMNLTSLQALVTGTDSIIIHPATLDLDIDPVLAITITGYLVLLPMQCWSRVAKANRARHLLISLWNAMMLVGAICALSLWPLTTEMPKQYAFCYPSYPDTTSVSNDGWQAALWENDWNTTVWSLFTNFTKYNLLSDNCFYPCFNTTRILRKPTSLNAMEYSVANTPRLNQEDLARSSVWISILPSLIYLAFGLTATATIYLLILSWLGNLTRIPVGDPRRLWRKKKEIWTTMAGEMRIGVRLILRGLKSPKAMILKSRSTSRHRHIINLGCFARFWLDTLTILVLLLAMILSPVTIVGFIVWIEWYIKHDGYNNETPQQVGQWGSIVAIGLILASALILQLKYTLASPADIKIEIKHTQNQLDKLHRILAEKEHTEQVNKESH